jgi:dTDP-4-dehydrorhamnose 3,5-epimerase-like enzyme
VGGVIEGLVVRELPHHLKKEGLTVAIWDEGSAPGPCLAASCQVITPGIVEAWFRRDKASERVICLEGMLKLVLCDRREGSATLGEVVELFLGEYRYREVMVPAGVLRGLKAVGNLPALVFVALQGEDGEGVFLSPEKAAVSYDWDIVMK